MYGAARDPMPALEDFARRHGVVVDRAIANASTSLPTHASFFTGLVPPRHGARYPQADDASPPAYAYPLRTGIPTLAELLAERGVWTLAVTANAGALGPAFGVSRGFDVYRARLDPAFAWKPRSPWRMASPLAEPLARLSALAPFRRSDLFGWGVAYRRAPAITDEAIALVDAAGERSFFLFVNYFDPHWPYNPPPACRDLFPGRFERWDRRGLDPRAVRQVTSGARDLTSAEREHLLSLYDGELACLDAQLARLLAHLERHPRWDEMLVIITSDHGEAFGEHRFLQHGVSLYDELTRVPFVAKPARGAGASEPGSRLPGPLQSVDVFATVLEHAGLRVPPDGDGRAWGRGRSRAQSWIGVKQRFVRWSPERLHRDLRALEEGGWKLIVSSDGSRELYDLDRDAGELADRCAEEPELRGRLEVSLGAPAAPRQRREPAPADAEALERLRALGYVQ
jgi:arylsulfatase A-like enzyme